MLGRVSKPKLAVSGHQTLFESSAIIMVISYMLQDVRSVEFNIDIGRRYGILSASHQARDNAGWPLKAARSKDQVLRSSKTPFASRTSSKHGTCGTLPKEGSFWRATSHSAVRAQTVLPIPRKIGMASFQLNRCSLLISSSGNSVR